MSEDIWERQQYLRLLEQIVTVKRLRAAVGEPVVAFELSVDWSGRPEEPAIWLILRTDLEREGLRRREDELRDAVRRMLLDGGYPAVGATTARIILTSSEEIKKRGGRQSYFS